MLRKTRKPPRIPTSNRVNIRKASSLAAINSPHLAVISSPRLVGISSPRLVVINSPRLVVINSPRLVVISSPRLVVTNSPHRQERNRLRLRVASNSRHCRVCPRQVEQQPRKVVRQAAHWPLASTRTPRDLPLDRS